MKSKKMFCVFMVFILLLLSPVTAFAKEFPTATDVEIDKVWTITFNEAVDPVSVNQDSIYIQKNEDDSKHSTTCTVEGSKVLVNLNENLEPDTSYTLVITKNVRSISQQGYLVEDVTKGFSIKSQTNPGNDLSVDFDGNDGYSGNYLLIVNTSTDEENIENTGPIPVVSQGFKTSKRFVNAIVNTVNDVREFIIYKEETNEYVNMETTLLYNGAKCNVWVETEVITDEMREQVEQLGIEYDRTIHSSVLGKFASGFDIDNNGKLSILVYEMEDETTQGFFSSSDFFSRDESNPGSNEMDIIYINTAAFFEMSNLFNTVAHELQHLVNYYHQLFEENDQNGMMTWIDEALALAAEHEYNLNDNTQSNYVDEYNNIDLEIANDIKNGHSLVYWDSKNSFPNYTLSYLFMQYLRIQADQGSTIYREVIEHPENNHKAVEAIIQKYIDPQKSFEEFMVDFRLALILNEATGLYGFKGETGFDNFTKHVYEGREVDLRSGGAILINIDGNFEPSGDQGEHIRYFGITLEN